jgi:hypothetical protein
MKSQSCCLFLINGMFQHMLLQKNFQQETKHFSMQHFCSCHATDSFFVQNPLGEGVWRKEIIWRYSKWFNGSKFSWNQFSSALFRLHGVFPQ